MNKMPFGNSDDPLGRILREAMNAPVRRDDPRIGNDGFPIDFPEEMKADIRRTIADRMGVPEELIPTSFWHERTREYLKVEQSLKAEFGIAGFGDDDPGRIPVNPDELLAASLRKRLGAGIDRGSSSGFPHISTADPNMEMEIVLKLLRNGSKIQFGPYPTVMDDEVITYLREDTRKTLARDGKRLEDYEDFTASLENGGIAVRGKLRVGKGGSGSEHVGLTQVEAERAVYAAFSDVFNREFEPYKEMVHDAVACYRKVKSGLNWLKRAIAWPFSALLSLIGFLAGLWYTGMVAIVTVATSFGFVPMGYAYFDLGVTNWFVLGALAVLGWIPLGTAAWLYGFFVPRTSHSHDRGRNGGEVITFNRPTFINHWLFPGKNQVAMGVHASMRFVEWWEDSDFMENVRDFLNVFFDPEERSDAANDDSYLYHPAISRLAQTLELGDEFLMETLPWYRDVLFDPNTRWAINNDSDLYEGSVDLALAQIGWFLHEHITYPLARKADNNESVWNALAFPLNYIIGFLRGNSYQLVPLYQMDHIRDAVKIGMQHRVRFGEFLSNTFAERYVQLDPDDSMEEEDFPAIQSGNASRTETVNGWPFMEIMPGVQIGAPITSIEDLERFLRGEAYGPSDDSNVQTGDAEIALPTEASATQDGIEFPAEMPEEMRDVARQVHADFPDGAVFEIGDDGFPTYLDAEQKATIKKSILGHFPEAQDTPAYWRSQWETASADYQAETPGDTVEIAQSETSPVEEEFDWVKALEEQEIPDKDSEEEIPDWLRELDEEKFPPRDFHEDEV